MTTFELASLVTSVAISLGQIGIVWCGIRAMNQASDKRARDRRQAARIADQRRAEAMRGLDTQHQALETLIRRTAPAAD